MAEHRELLARLKDWIGENHAKSSFVLGYILGQMERHPQSPFWGVIERFLTVKQGRTD